MALKDVVIKRIENAVTIVASTSVGSKGDTGSQWRTGDGNPADSLGVDGDLYLNNLSKEYFQRTGGVYVHAGIFVGTNGANGTDGTDGIDGTDGVSIDHINTSKVNGTTTFTIYTSTDDSVAIGSFEISDGIDGSDGSDGANGINGTNGSNGANGADGDTGADGPIGPTGVQGIQGETGEQGTGVTIVGSDTTANINASTGVNIGDMKISTDDGHGFVWNGSSWDDVGQIQGPIGLTGADGPTGPTGSAGTNGTNGTNGTDGSDGIDGSTGSAGSDGSDGAVGTSVAIVGTDTTVNISNKTGVFTDIWISSDNGEGYAWNGASWFSIGQLVGDTGAQGIQGDTGGTGIQGVTGDTGSDGATGPAGSDGADGFSAVTEITQAAYDALATEVQENGTIYSITDADLPVGPTGAGVPTGGTVGQVLEKIDGTDYNTQWADASDGGNPENLEFVTSSGASDALVGGDKTGNIRGTGAMDIQSTRGVVTQISGGTNAVAVGSDNTASGNNSISIGRANSAIGDLSVSVGYNNSTDASLDFASGVSNTASGSGGSSSAVGVANNATGSGSVSIGYDNTASGSDSTAVGYSNEATGSASISIGYNNNASQTNSIAVGNTAQSLHANASVFGYRGISRGIDTATICAASSGSVKAQIELGSDGTFTIVQTTDGSTWNDVTPSDGSADPASIETVGSAMIGGDKSGNTRGSNSLDIQSGRDAVTQVANGADSIAVGRRNTASASSSSAFGNGNIASGNTSSAFGKSNTATGTESTAVGRSNAAGGIQSISIGYVNNASGDASSAIGYSNTALFGQASSIGYDNAATGLASSAVGSLNTASGQDSSAIGSVNTAHGIKSSAVGSNNLIDALHDYCSIFGGNGVSFASNTTLLAATDSTGTNRAVLELSETGDLGTRITTNGGSSWGPKIPLVESDPSAVTGADSVSNIISLTQAEYDAIGSPDASTFYVITD